MIIMMIIKSPLTRITITEPQHNGHHCRHHPCHHYQYHRYPSMMYPTEINKNKNYPTCTGHWANRALCRLALCNRVEQAPTWSLQGDWDDAVYQVYFWGGKMTKGLRKGEIGNDTQAARAKVLISIFCADFSNRIQIPYSRKQQLV